MGYLKAFLYRKRNSMAKVICNPLRGNKHRTRTEALTKGVTFIKATDYNTVSHEDVFTLTKKIVYNTLELFVILRLLGSGKLTRKLFEKK